MSLVQSFVKIGKLLAAYTHTHKGMGKVAQEAPLFYFIKWRWPVR